MRTPVIPTTLTWRAYVLRCTDDSLYAGVTNDVARRLAAHNAGRGARYTRARRPVVLAWRSRAMDKRAAHRLEARLKQLSRAEKLLVIGPAGAARRRVLAHLARASSSPQRA